MLMMLLLGVVCFFLRTGGLGCCCLVVILVIMLTLLRLGWLLTKNIWLWLNTSLMVTGIHIMSAGWPYLGAPLGSQNFITDYTQDCVSQWVQDLSYLS